MRQGADRSPLRDRGFDLYETPACATIALIRSGELDRFGVRLLWEPCAGRGAIARELTAVGFRVVAQDLVAHDGADDGIETPIDFLMEGEARGSAVVTNPPFSLANEFIRHGLSLGVPVIVLLRLMAIEGAKRSDLIDRHLVRVWAGIERLPKFHREGWTGPRQKTETSPFAWMVFSPQERGTAPIELRRMSWRAP